MAKLLLLLPHLTIKFKINLHCVLRNIKVYLLNYLVRRNENLDNSHAPGTPVALLSTYDGSPRYQQMSYQNAMSVVAKHGKLDIFITKACNPK